MTVISKIAGLVVGAGIFAAIFYFITSFAYRFSGLTIGFSAFLAFPLGAMITWNLIAASGALVLWMSAPEDEWRSFFLLFSAFVPTMGLGIYLWGLVIGSIFFQDYPTFWGRFAASATITAVLLGIFGVWYFVFGE